MTTNASFPKITVSPLLALIVAAVVLSMVLVIPAHAETPFLNGWKFSENNMPVEPVSGQADIGTIHLSPVVVPTQPYSTDNPTNRDLYLGECPIGTDEAPQLRDTELSSGALCRGACGIDCPYERCMKRDDVEIPYKDGTCVYTNVVSCPSHQGCRDHDACYDICTEQLGDNSLLFGTCHGVCNQRCYDKWGHTNCYLWAAFPGIASSTVSGIVDFVESPKFDTHLTYSDRPVFKPASLPPEIKPDVPIVKHYTATMYAVYDNASLDATCPSATSGYASGGDDPYCEKTLSFNPSAVMCGKPPAKCIDTSWNNGIHGTYSYVNVLGARADGSSYAKDRLKDGFEYYFSTSGTTVSEILYQNGSYKSTVI